MSTLKHNPWLWVPTLYLIEGIPYVIVNNISMAMLTAMGVPNGQMALFTSLLYLPWIIKPLWGPIVDIVRTKRWWIISMQVLLTACFIGLALTIPQPEAAMIAEHTTPIHLFMAMLIIFWITAFVSATHDIAADGFYILSLNESQQAAFVGIRSTFYRIATILGQGALLFVVGRLSLTRDISSAWQLAFFAAAILLGVCTLWHTRALPHEEQKTTEIHSLREVLKTFAHTWTTFFQKKGLAIAILFLLLFRLPEALILKIIYPFMMASVDNGGLALTLDTIGIVYSTIGLICLTIGGIIGGLFVSRIGIYRAFWWMVAAITLPDLAYVYLAYAQPEQLLWITVAIAIEQFGYGFGFTAYMLYMIRCSEGKYCSSHYAICTMFMALSMMLPGMIAGYLQEAIGYSAFFLLAMGCCLVTVIVSVPISKQLKHNPTQND